LFVCLEGVGGGCYGWREELLVEIMTRSWWREKQLLAIDVYFDVSQAINSALEFRISMVITNTVSYC
jgi:hypothetical protein